MNERFRLRLDIQPETGCWNWTGYRNRNGYGQFYFNGRQRPAHCYAWEVKNGPVPYGTEIDHLCRNRACVNPDHLEAVPHRENILRGVGPIVVNATKTHCVHGHEFTPENTMTYRRGNSLRRYCRTCRRRLQRIWRQRTKHNV